MTADLIDLHYSNNVEHYCDNSTDFCDRLFNFIEQNLQFTSSQIAKYARNDPYWRQVELSLIQLSGLEDGHRAVRTGLSPEGPRVSTNISGVLLLNLMTEFGELEQVLGRKHKTDLSDSHCSAIVKVLEDGSDLFVSHNTWTGYSNMLRILKRYTYNYEDISGNTIALSSYPGVIYSIDDFYLISSGLTVLETTIGNYNNSLWKNVVADRMVFEFIRNTVANRLATSGKQWTRVFAKFNSGTYNNQFMIVDYNKFQKGVHPSRLSDDLLWVLEQMPGVVEFGDVTHVLRRQHYWPSYNVPYFQSIYDISDQESQVKKYGDFFTYNRTARALIFKRDHKNITDISSLYRLMRYNDFKNDPLSRCDCSPPYSGEYAIAARSDLNDPKGRYPFGALSFRPHGAIDVKITNADLLPKLEMVATSGPTYEQQPPFQWSNTKIVGVRHTGQPNLFKFGPVHVKWSPPDQINIQL